MGKLSGKRIAVLVADGFEQSELSGARDWFVAEGASVDILHPDGAGTVCGWDNVDWGEEVEVDRSLEAVDVTDYDLLYIPGGRIGPDILRGCVRAVLFVRAFAESGRPVSATGHGLSLLTEADIVKGLTVTGYRTLRTDLVNAGAFFRDEAAVSDRGIVTGRGMAEMESFLPLAVEAASSPLRPRGQPRRVIEAA